MASPTLYAIFAKDVPALCVDASAPDTCIWVCDPSAVYRPRDPGASDFYACVEDNCEELERVYDERYSKQHGCWRPIIRSVIEEFLDCGDLRHGFARVWCSACRSEYLLRVLMQTQIFLPLVSPEESHSLCRARRARSPQKSPRPPVRRHDPQDAPLLLQARPQASRPPEPVLLPDTQTVPPGTVPRETSRSRNDRI